MNAITLFTLLLSITLHTTNAGFGIKVRDVECAEELEDPKYAGKRCTIVDITTRRFSFNWYKLEYPEIVFVNSIVPYIPLDLEMEMGTFELVNLTSVNLQFIDQSNFNQASKLTQLYLGGNAFYEVPAKTFSGAPTLKILDLSGNEVEKMAPDAFNGLKNLLELHLNGNALKNINFSELSDLVELRKIDVGYNSFTEIDVTDIKKYLPKLEWIGLKGIKMDCGELSVIGQKLRDVSVFTDVVDDLTGEVLPDADCIKSPLREMLFD